MLTRKKRLNSISERQISGSDSDAKASSPQHERADRSSLPEADFLQPQLSTFLHRSQQSQGYRLITHCPSTENTRRVCFTAFENLNIVPQRIK